MYTLSKKLATPVGGRRHEPRIYGVARAFTHAFDNLARKREEGKVNIFSLLSLSMGRGFGKPGFPPAFHSRRMFSFSPSLLSFLSAGLQWARTRQHSNSKPSADDRPCFWTAGIYNGMYVCIHCPSGNFERVEEGGEGSSQKSRALSKHEQRGEGGESFEKGERRKEAKKPISNMDRETTASRSRCCGHGGRIMLRFFLHTDIVLLSSSVRWRRKAKRGQWVPVKRGLAEGRKAAPFK